MADIDERILRLNPWWRDPEEGLREDTHLTRFRDAAARWDPPVLDGIEPEPGDTHTLRGPRQSGKTTLLKRLLARLLRRGATRVLYFSFDLESDPGSIYQVIRRARALHPAPEGRWHLFLDEVTSIDEWQRGVKHCWDSGLTTDDFMLVTGSSAHDVKKGGEQLPGRRGAGRDLVQLPMSFRDFCRVTGAADLPDGDTVDPEEVLTEEGRRRVREAHLDLERLRRALRMYRETGGFPAAVSDHVATGDVTDRTVRTLWRTMSGDVAREGLDQTAAAKLLEQVSVSLGSRLAWTSAAEAMDVRSPKTAKRYAEHLAESFALLVVHFWDLSGGTLRPQKMRKAYFLDPLIARVPPLLMPGARTPDPDGVLESLVAVGLFRSSAGTLVQSTPAPGSVAYWRSSSGREIDFVVPRRESPAERFPVEVKGDASSSIANARKAIRQSFGSGLVTTRTRLDLEGDPDVPAVPVSVLLALLGERPARR